MQQKRALCGLYALLAFTWGIAALRWASARWGWMSIGGRFRFGVMAGCRRVRATAQKQWRRLEQEQDQELSRRSARVTFVLAKVTKTAPARHEPVRWSRTGPPRSSRRTARRPNSLRSNRGASSAARHCGARLALRRDVLTATANGNSKGSRATAKDSKRERRLHSNGG